MRPIAGSGGARVSMLGTAPRADGKAQLTYKGHPLYLFSGDRKPGDT
jgi:predicted lipoprotein with Yx(FWY)xxD motif